MAAVINFLQEAHCGDLAFFDSEAGNIIHVGILLNEHEIIHSSGKVRIDKIDTQGILNLETKQRTHKLEDNKKVFLKPNRFPKPGEFKAIPGIFVCKILLLH